MHSPIEISELWKLLPYKQPNKKTPKITQNGAKMDWNGKYEPNCIKTKNRPLCYCHQQLTKFDVIVLKNGAATDTKQAREKKLCAHQSCKSPERVNTTNNIRHMTSIWLITDSGTRLIQRVDWGKEEINLLLASRFHLVRRLSVLRVAVHRHLHLQMRRAPQTPHRIINQPCGGYSCFNPHCKSLCALFDMDPPSARPS
jgi:hypothetical protein